MGFVPLREAKPPLPLNYFDGDGYAGGIQDDIFAHGSRRTNHIALSFDACPTSGTPSFAPEIVDFLDRERVPATYFVSGRWAEANRDAFARIMRAELSEIALHGYRHPRLIAASDELIRDEIENGRQALLQLGATPVPLFRPPYMDIPPSLPAVARSCGVLTIAGDARMGDSDPTTGSEGLEREAIHWAQAGSIIMLHVNGRGVGTATAVRNLVPAFMERGYSFVTVGELVRRSAGPA
jgi:peptidoglycan/xylan/chitin deacetylase (PgdA/CDA1 family)